MLDQPPNQPLEAWLRAIVTTLAVPQGRVVGTAGHAAARRELVDRLHAVGAEPYGDEFELPYGPGKSLCNVMGVMPGRDRAAAPVVVAAHYDTCGAQPGADDNAAAIAIALALAGRLRAEPAQRDVVLGFFDGEEPPHFLSKLMGSIAWYHHQRKGPVHCAIAMDLVGHAVPIPKGEDLLFVLGLESDPGLASISLAARDLKIQPALHRYAPNLSDHYIFCQQHRPFVFLTCGRWEHYHAITDTPEKLDYSKMAAIVDVAESCVRQSAMATLDGPFSTGQTLPRELEAVRSNFGLDLNSRDDMDAFVHQIMAAHAL